VKLLIDPIYNRIHFVIRVTLEDWDIVDNYGVENPPPNYYEADQTACGTDVVDFNSPEYGEAKIGVWEIDTNDPNLCPQCKRINEEERKRLESWNAEAK